MRWNRVRRTVGMAVAWGRERVSSKGITTIGVDEIAQRSGLLTLAYRLDTGCPRLLQVGQDRRITRLESLFERFGKECAARLPVACSDMWQACPRVVREQAGQVRHVPDSFRVVRRLGKAFDQVRAAEA